MKKIITTLLFGSLCYSMNVAAQAPHLPLTEEPFNEAEYNFNHPNKYVERLQAQQAGGNSYRIIATNSEVYGMGGWSETDSAHIIYHRDTKISNNTYWIWNNISSTWQYNTDQNLTYNAQHQNTEYISRNWSGTAWINDQKAVYIYGSAPGYTEYYIYSWSGTWDYNYHFNITYNSVGGILSFTRQYWNAGVWENTNQTLRTFNADNFETEVVYRIWDGSTWQNNVRNTYTRDADNHITVLTVENWIGGTWVGDYRWVKTYNSSGFVTESVEQNYNGSSWENYSRYLYSYSSNNLLTIEDYQLWDNIALGWYNSDRNVYQYDINDKMETMTHYTMGMGWSFDYRYIYAYDANNYLYSVMRQNYGMGWDNVNRLFYYYESYLPSAIESIGETDIISLYPNPTEGISNLVFESKQNESLQLSVYNTLGQSVKTETVEAQAGKNSIQLDLSTLNSGSYFLRISNGKEQKTLPLQIR